MHDPREERERERVRSEKVDNIFGFCFAGSLVVTRKVDLVVGSTRGGFNPNPIVLRLLTLILGFSLTQPSGLLKYNYAVILLLITGLLELMIFQTMFSHSFI